MKAVAPLLLLASACGGSGEPALPDAGVSLDAAAPDAPPPVFTAPSGTTMVLSATIPVGSRSIVLFVPAFGYDPADTTFLLVNDGQDVIPLGVALALDDLWKKDQLRPMVVVALPVTPGGDRLHDYGTAEHDVTIACDTGTQILGTRAADYARYVIDQALPAAEAAVGFAASPARTGFIGASLGGLSAFSIAWDHPEVFAFAGVMSGSLWWRTHAGTVEERQNSRIMHAIVARSEPRPGLRAWFQAGTNDETADRDEDGVIDAIDDTLDLMAALRAKGFEDGVSMVYREVERGIHGYPTWRVVFPEFLLWAAGK